MATDERLKHLMNIRVQALGQAQGEPVAADQLGFVATDNFAADPVDELNPSGGAEHQHDGAGDIQVALEGGFLACELFGSLIHLNFKSLAARVDLGRHVVEAARQAGELFGVLCHAAWHPYRGLACGDTLRGVDQRAQGAGELPGEEPNQ